jgi:hypothetical protein
LTKQGLDPSHLGRIALHQAPARPGGRHDYRFLHEGVCALLGSGEPDSDFLTFQVIARLELLLSMESVGMIVSAFAELEKNRIAVGAGRPKRRQFARITLD